MLVWVMTTCWVLCSTLTYFIWRNMNISSISYFWKSTLINTQYSSLCDTLKMMLFIKYIIKWKCIGRMNWKFWFKILYRIKQKKKKKKKIDVILNCLNAPLIVLLYCDDIHHEISFIYNLGQKKLRHLYLITLAF